MSFLKFFEKILVGSYLFCFEQIFINMSIKEQILEYRQKGYSYQQIKKVLGCSKGTISYHLGEGQKMKAYNRIKKQRMIYPWLKKSEHFFDMYGDSELLTGRERGFDRKKINDYLQTIERCYLSGRVIDVNDVNTYEFDHIYPRTLGGSNTFDNLGVARPEANRAKSDLTVEEFIELCKDVLINFGYDVIKK